MKKTLCLFLSVLMCIFFSSCGKVDNASFSSYSYMPESAIGAQEMNLLYSAGDSFNPYTAKTEYNRELSRLIYDPLFKYDNDFEPCGCLASNVKLDGKNCTVFLKSAHFTDGSTVTADDIIYSYNAAKKSDTIYSSLLYEVSSVSAAGNTVVFDLTKVDSYFLNLLNFPVIKAGSDGQKNSDGVEIPPIGCGRYRVSDDAKSLLLNEKYHGDISGVAKINLINAPDEKSAVHYVEVGAADFYYAEESSGNIARMSGKRADVNINNFVYIGVNSNYAPLSDNHVRYAISAAIDREEICHSAYFDNATPASGFINPEVKETQAVQSLKTVADLQITVENLGKIGYNKLDKGYYVNYSGKHLSFNLLVNSDNSSRVVAAKLISDRCRAAGIEINVVECSYAEYISLLSAGNFQLYLGEIKVPANMDLSELTVAGGSVAYGVKSSFTDEITGVTAKTVCEEMTEKYHSGECSLADLAGTLLTEMPQIPVCYRNGILFYTSRIKNSAEPSACDIFFSFENYKF